MTLLIATHNENKVKEFARILSPLGIEVTYDPSLPDVEETGTTFAENAYIKALAACKVSGLPAVADDSGICVDALNGGPGIYSARYAPEKEQNSKLLSELEGLPKEKRGAHYAAAICCVFPNGNIITSHGTCEGFITTEPRGTNGFGYDPIFECPDGRTFGEKTAEEKDSLSHRSKALTAFAERLMEYQNKE